MTQNNDGILTVLTAPLFDPAASRSRYEIPPGKTVAEIVSYALPDAPSELSRIRVALVTERGSLILPYSHWTRVRPRAGVNVVIRVIPGKNALRSILQIVVAISAIALGQYWLAPLLGGGVVGAIGAAVLGAGVPLNGQLQIDCLSRPAKPYQGQSDHEAS